MTSVNKVEKASPKITAVESWTHHIEVMPPNRMSRLMKSMVTCVAIGISPMMVVIVVTYLFFGRVPIATSVFEGLKTAIGSLVGVRP